MITYAPFWKTIKEKGESTYTLIEKHGISSATIDRLRKTKESAPQKSTICAEFWIVRCRKFWNTSQMTTKNSAVCAVFQYFRFTRRHLEYIIQTQYIIYINILNRIEADYGKRKGTIRQRNHGYEREFPPMVHRRGA